METIKIILIIQNFIPILSGCGHLIQARHQEYSVAAWLQFTTMLTEDVVERFYRTLN
jgi:hypothetical protein